MWSAIQSILDLISQNSDIIAGLLAAALGYQSGALGWILKKILSKLIKKGAQEGKDLAQIPQDKKTEKEGEELQKPIADPSVKDDVIQKRKEHFKKVIGGK